MERRSVVRVWKVALAAVALAATVMALYVQLFERRSREEESRLSAARLEDMLAESRVRLRSEILAQLRAELARGASPEEPGDQPIPNAVLRRGESGGGRVLEQALDSQSSQQAALARLQESLDSWTHQAETSDRALRRDLEELRAEIRRDQDVFGKTLSLMVAALIPLVLHLLTSLWTPEERARDQGSDERGGSGAA